MGWGYLTHRLPKTPLDAIALYCGAHSFGNRKTKARQDIICWHCPFFEGTVFAGGMCLRIVPYLGLRGTHNDHGSQDLFMAMTQAQEITPLL